MIELIRRLRNRKLNKRRKECLLAPFIGKRFKYISKYGKSEWTDVVKSIYISRTINVQDFSVFIEIMVIGEKNNFHYSFNNIVFYE